MKWIKTKISKWLDLPIIHKQLERQSNELNTLREIIKERTEYHIDVHQYSNSQIILIGKYNNRDFIKCYNISDHNLNDLISHCRKLDKFAKVGKIDSYPDFSAVIKNEIE